jgi:hypothetical protein
MKNSLLNQDYKKIRLIRSLKKFIFKNICLLMCDVKVFLTFIFVVKILQVTRFQMSE